MRTSLFIVALSPALILGLALGQDSPAVKLPSVVHTSPGAPTKLQGGTYRIWAYTTTNASGEVAVQIVIVADGQAIPGPVIPPGPDPLIAELQDLYTADSGADKAKNLANLAKLYRRMPEQATDPAVKTTGKLFEILTTSRKALMDDAALVSIRTRLGQAFTQAGIPTTDTPLTDAIRVKAATEFNRLAAAMEAVK